MPRRRLIVTVRYESTVTINKSFEYVTKQQIEFCTL